MRSRVSRQAEIPGVKLRGFFTLGIQKLFLALGNSHSHGDSSAHHGVVAHRKTPIFAVLLLNNIVFSRNKLLKISKYHFY